VTYSIKELEKASWQNGFWMIFEEKPPLG